VKTPPIVSSLCLLMSLSPGLVLGDDSTCPRTFGSPHVFSQPWPKSESWFGSEALAVRLPIDGYWLVHDDGQPVGDKVFWWSSGFEPGDEINLQVRIERIGIGENNATVSRSTNAYAESLGGWAMLTVIDPGSSGCWRVSAEYKGQSLSFIVETADRRSGHEDAT
jgi:hypothetical protein